MYNMNAFILDSHNKLCPVGFEGVFLVWVSPVVIFTLKKIKNYSF